MTSLYGLTLTMLIPKSATTKVSLPFIFPYEMDTKRSLHTSVTPSLPRGTTPSLSIHLPCTRSRGTFTCQTYWVRQKT
ncbi:hypothetical protein EDD18DRAFT_185074 [Armillaria luteobubalina]|uniref:Uncharacterized protein n=1 Tax=Armillaria luteobubalina TaxID=153913 RepID=A0AA39Q693_9AGAR|nr:hypothetical protein EDD18DRAFT_185074 [Armillaria luteobubalina]